MFYLLLILILSSLTYWKLIRPHKYWSRYGILQTKPKFLLGDMWMIFFQKETIFEMVQRMYNMYHDVRYIGVYQFLTPALLIRDPDLIKQITVKDFDHFLDHQGFVPPEGDSLFGQNLFNMRGQKWREMRNILSPSFTGSKMKFMFSLMSQSGENFVKHFSKKEESLITVEMKDTFSKFAINCIGNTVFGIECDTLEDANSEFYLMAKEASDFTSLRKMLVFMGYAMMPKLLAFFNVKLYSKEMKDYFTRVVKENIKSREEQGVVRPDMISILLEAQKQNERVITEEDIVAQVVVFFFAGFDTVSTTMCFIAYELAINPEVQEKLKREIDETRKKCNGKITYEDIAAMKYMDMVVSESSRKWPVFPVMDRLCTKPYTIKPKNPNEKPLLLNKNDLIFLPIYALHRDPEYYPDPERFDPERFNDENKSKIVPYTHIPFGAGPRLCIGLRFAILETKILFYNLLSHFEIIPVEKTQIPIKFDKKAMNVQAEKGFWLGLQKRQL